MPPAPAAAPARTGTTNGAFRCISKGGVMIVLPDKPCPECQTKMHVKASYRRQQWFLACPRYPECRHGEDITQEMIDNARQQGSSNTLVTEAQRLERNKKSKRRYHATANNDIRQTLLDRQQGMCSYCGDTLTLESMHVDHLVPISSGGSDNLDNLQAVCALDNTSKGALSDAEYRRKLNRIQWYTSEQYAQEQAHQRGYDSADDWRKLNSPDWEQCWGFPKDSCDGAFVHKDSPHRCAQCDDPLCESCAGGLCFSCELQNASSE